MLTIKDGKVVKPPLNSCDPWEISANSDAILPAGAPIMSYIFVPDKVAVVFCNGKNQWYREEDKPVDAGKPIADLFK